jgi:hypothetical protein
MGGFDLIGAVMGDGPMVRWYGDVVFARSFAFLHACRAECTPGLSHPGQSVGWT